MSWVGWLFLILAGALALFRFYFYLQSKRMVGAHAPSLGSGQEGGLPERGTSLIYFYSPDCGPCRKMTPLVRQLDARYGRVKRVDVSQDLETARSYQVRAVPTTVLVEDGRISKVLIGFQSLAKLEGLLSADG